MTFFLSRIGFCGRVPLGIWAIVLPHLVLRLLCKIPRLITARLGQKLMPRLPYAGTLLVIAALLSAPVSAQQSVPNSTQNNARVEHVVVRGSGAATEVEIQTSGMPVGLDTQTLTGPDRIVVDFPGALPAAELRALKVNLGALKGVRAGLFFQNPPITRVVLDLLEPQSYQISTIKNAIVVKLAQANPGSGAAPVAKIPQMQAAHAATLQNASLTTGPASAARISPAVSNTTAPTLAPMSDAPPPLVAVSFADGMLRIRAQRATLAQLLFEVHRETRAEIAIPAGAEQEEVAADLGPAPAREVLASLLNGSPYNFIFVGNELSLERVILTRRDPSIF